MEMERRSEAHLWHTHLHLSAGPDSRGAEEEMDGWVFSLLYLSGEGCIAPTKLFMLFLLQTWPPTLTQRQHEPT